MPDELFTSAFRALVELGGAGWIVSGLFLLGIVYLYRENNRIRDRAEAISERTVIALERVGAINQNVATVLDGGTKSREDMARLLAEIAKRTESIEGKQAENLSDILRSVRDLVEVQRSNDKEFIRLSGENKQILDEIRAGRLEMARTGHSAPAGA